jgi:hypothetical protein
MLSEVLSRSNGPNNLLILLVCVYLDLQFLFLSDDAIKKFCSGLLFAPCLAFKF